MLRIVILRESTTQSDPKTQYQLDPNKIPVKDFQILKQINAKRTSSGTIISVTKAGQAKYY